MKLMQIVILVLLSICMSLSVAECSGDLTVSGATITSDLAISDLDCTGGTLTTDSLGVVSCSDPGCSRSACFATGLAILTCGGSSFSVVCPGAFWTHRSAAEANGWWSVTYGGGLFVAVTNTGTNRVMTSPDGITWTPRSAAEANQWMSVTYGGGLFVAVAYDGTNRVMTSP